MVELPTILVGAQKTNTALEIAMGTTANTLCDMVQRAHGTLSDRPKEYHDLTHTLEVVDATAEICIEVYNDRERRAELPVIDVAAVILAAYGHDTIYEVGGYGHNEERSAAYTETITSHCFMQGGFDLASRRHFANRVGQIIRASKVVLLNNPPQIIQSADCDDLAQMILCDADCASFGKPVDYCIDRKVALFREQNHDITDRKERIERFIEFMNRSVDFLRNGDFYTAEARRLFPDRLHNASIIEKLLKDRNPLFFNFAQSEVVDS